MTKTVYVIDTKYAYTLEGIQITHASEFIKSKLSLKKLSPLDSKLNFP